MKTTPGNDCTVPNAAFGVGDTGRTREFRFFTRLFPPHRNAETPGWLTGCSLGGRNVRRCPPSRFCLSPNERSGFAERISLLPRFFTAQQGSARNGNYSERY
ncbi:hypothetical protein ZHAS_00015802 [Anopheles sinensis]|uniref:Uncharacterized protein n=1 Tax=Anopheles sinensis TaxID=74873 RepID=A0A084WBZ1_ANOSI|nr:hypothetical protein ZHAS_00015802 [Anopheles sinensis]